jgi:hypothetical protein
MPLLVDMSKSPRIITLAFLTPHENDHWVNRLAARMCSHPFCHVELFFESTQQSFSILWGGTACFRGKNLSNPNYTVVSLCVSEKEYNLCLEFCRCASTQNLSFDERGMWLSWFTSSTSCCGDTTSQLQGRTFCSKIITEALQFGGLKEVEDVRPSCVTPSRLFELVRSSNRVACNSVPFKRQVLVACGNVR